VKRTIILLMVGLAGCICSCASQERAWEFISVGGKRLGTYVGGLRDEKQHGWGRTEYFEDHRERDEYVGYSKDGMAHGQGTLTYKDGTKHVGEFSEGFLVRGRFTTVAPPEA
jgi:hypothetical protein